MISIRLRSFHARSARGFLALLLGLAFSLQITRAASVDPSTLVSKAEVGTLLGQPVLRVLVMPEETDEDTGGKVIVCTFQARLAAAFASVTTFASAKEAEIKMSKQQIAARYETEVKQIEEEKGLGDRAYWSTSERGAQMVVIKGARVFAIAVGGKLPNPPASYRQELHALAATAAAKL